MTSLPPADFSRVVRAVELVRLRLLRTAATLESAGIPYAVIGGNAVAAWVTRADPGAVRNTPDVDILIRRDDFPGVKNAMETAEFCHVTIAGIETFLDSPDVRPRSGVHICFANEKFRSEDLEPAADVSQSVSSIDGKFTHVSLEPLVRMKLTSYRIIDRVHLRDLASVELIDASWPAKFQPILAARLQQILDDPDG